MMQISRHVKPSAIRYRRYDPRFSPSGPVTNCSWGDSGSSSSAAVRSACIVLAILLRDPGTALWLGDGIIVDPAAYAKLVAELNIAPPLPAEGF